MDRELKNLTLNISQLAALSGLQRIEYLAFVQQRTAKFDAEEGELPEAERQIAFLRMGMDINAWLVSRSLWNAESPALPPSATPALHGEFAAPDSELFALPPSESPAPSR